jgi:heme/copper-type cytochrome/quinol oxidase subunit 1
MASVLDFVLVGVVFAVHTAIAAVMTRFFRIQLETRAGAATFVAFLIPVTLVLTTLLFTGVLGVGGGLDLSATALVATLVGVPLALGVTIDVLYMPTPDEYDLPDTRS